MKPLGLTPDFRVTYPTQAEDKVYEAVEAAIAAGWTVERFRRCAAGAWDYELDEAKKQAAKEWSQP